MGGFDGFGLDCNGWIKIIYLSINNIKIQSTNPIHPFRDKIHLIQPLASF
jgi:hypothetical protein